MATVHITFKDGEKKTMTDRGRSGGSYCQTVRYEGAFVIIKDAYGEQTAYPAADIKELRIESTERGW